MPSNETTRPASPAKAERPALEPGVLKNVLASHLDLKNRRAQSNAANMAQFLSLIENESTAIRAGGGDKAIAAQHAKGRLTARERLELLLDPGAGFFELGLFAAYGMY
jgi:3-methylcrotonyl-CoA carboxylase beta subunit